MSCFIVNVLKCMCVNEEKNLFLCAGVCPYISPFTSYFLSHHHRRATRIHVFSFTHPSEEAGHNTEFLFKKKKQSYFELHLTNPGVRANHYTRETR